MENEFMQTKRHFSKLGLMFFLGTLIVYGVQSAAIGIANAINPNLLSNGSYSLLITMIPMYVIAMPIMALLIRTVPAEHIEQKSMTVGQWFLSFLMCYSGLYIANLVGTMITQLIGMLKGSPVTNTIFQIATSSNLFVNFFIMVLCAPIFEEFLFRKLLIDRTVKYGEGVAILFSGLMFGLFHGNLNQFAYAFVLGLFFGFIYVKTGNIRYTILLHMLVNFIGSILSMLMFRILDYDSLMESLNDPSAITAYATTHLPQLIIYIIYALILLGISIAGIILLIVNAKKISLRPGEIVIPKGKRFSTTILNLGMGVYFLFWIIMIIVQLFT